MTHTRFGTCRPVLVVLHRDVTDRVRMESVMSHIMQAQLEMLCDIFPR